MAIIQTTDQVRYLKRKNLEEEARVMGNFYSDIIAMYGIDCIYHKKDMSDFDDFKGIVDSNTILKRAYGYDITPQYKVSADMVAFAEVDTDIFNINKIGYTPNTDITLVFDSTRFACDMAPKIGRYKEYRVDEREVVCEVPPFDNHDEATELWPFEIGLGDAGTFSCQIMEGRMRCALSGYQVGVEQTVVCDPYQHVDFKVSFPKNEDLYYSLEHVIQNDDYLETMLFLTFRVDKLAIGGGRFKYILHGRTHGSVLFFDLDQLGKYSERIHPNIGDIVEIDFPDDSNREKYEITDCFDKQLTQDGINPLLHKYIWKCKARRYINSYEDDAPASNEADARLVERNDYDAVIQEEVAEKISVYENIDENNNIRQDAAYGGYDGVIDRYDKQAADRNYVRYDLIEGSQAIDIMRFGCGARLVTDGYDLIFVTAAGDAYIVAKMQHNPTVNKALFECGLKWLKATESSVVFVNIEGESFVLAMDTASTDGNIEKSIDDMYEATVGQRSINTNGDNFFKFEGTRTVLFATQDRLYAKLAYGGRTYQLI